MKLPVLISFLAAGMFAAGCMRDPAKASRLSANDPLCEIHHTVMQKKTVPISYGMPVYPEDIVALLKAQQKSFPNALDYVEGGCVVSNDSPTTAEIWECADCRAAKNKWLAAHPPAKAKSAK